jgi:hypothetical protein
MLVLSARRKELALEANIYLLGRDLTGEFADPMELSYRAAQTTELLRSTEAGSARADCAAAAGKIDNICCRPLSFLMRICSGARNRRPPAVPLAHSG